MILTSGSNLNAVGWISIMGFLHVFYEK